MPVWQSYFATHQQLQDHRTASPIDHPDRSITRAKMEYPTEDVSLAYLLSIGKLTLGVLEGNIYAGLVTVDSFTDKAVGDASYDSGGSKMFAGRFQDAKNTYTNFLYSGLSTADHRLSKISAGGETVLAEEAVDITQHAWYTLKLSCSGSTMKSTRAGVTISATDTEFASGSFGRMMHGHYQYNYDKYLPAFLRAPSSPLPKALAIMEVEVIGSGKEDDPYRPNLAQQLDEHPRYGSIDKLAVTWGAFDHKPQHNTMLIMITGDNPYQSGAVIKQVEYAKSRGLRVLPPPTDYASAVEQYRRLKRDYPYWLAGVENYCYQALGHPDIEPLAVADFYYGELIEHKTHYDQLRRVPDWELERTLKRWYERLKRVKAVPIERKELHLRKMEEIFKKGW